MFSEEKSDVKGEQKKKVTTIYSIRTRSGYTEAELEEVE